MKTVFLILSGAMFIVGLVFGPIKVNISGLPSATILPGLSVESQADEPSEWYSRTTVKPSDATPAKPQESRELPSVPPAPSSPSVADFAKEVERINREMLHPWLEKVDKITDQVDKLEKAKKQTDASTERAFAGIRDELATMKKDIRALANPTEKAPRNPDVEELKSSVTQLSKAMDRITEQLSAIQTPPRREPELPKTPATRNLTKRDVTWPCGYQLLGVELDIPATGAWVGCPKCGGKVFVK